MLAGVQRFLVLATLVVVVLLARLHPVMLACCLPLTSTYCALIAARIWFAGDRARAWAVVPLAGLLSGLALASLPAALIHAIAAAGGLALAALLRRGWSFGWCLALASTVVFAAVAAQMIVGWSDVRAFVTVMSNARISQLADSGVPDDGSLDFLRWWDLNYVYIGFGFAFGSVLLMSTFLLSVLDRFRRDPEAIAKRKPTGFQRMQVPDWAVWIAIMLAVMWFAEQRWPNEALRIVTWNAAIGLSFVYWLNGFSILLYALSVFKATVFGTFMVFTVFMLFSSLLPALSVFGFFDTWYDFRTRFRRLAILRRLSQQDRGRDQ
jgi:hypothetical protein